VTKRATLLSARLRLLIRVGGLIVSTACLAAQNKDTLETKVVAQGGSVVLQWSKKHPWSARLQSQGAALIAEYRTKTRGVVSEVLRTAVAKDSDERALAFRLPDALTSPPEGPVCLYFQLPSRQVLPVRRATDSGSDTARFRYDAWTREAAKRANAESLRLNVEVTRRKIAVNAQDRAAQQQIVGRNGRGSNEACDAIPPPSLAASERPFDAVSPNEQPDIATLVCTLRIANGEADDDFESARGPHFLETLFEQIPEPSRLGDPNLIQRRRQLDGFIRDWDRWSPQLAAYVSRYRTPHFGARTDSLELPATTAKAARALAQGRRPDAPDIPGYVGSSIESYLRCVEDGKKQLQTKFLSWQALASSEPTRVRAAHQQLVLSCKRDVSKLEELTRDGAALVKQLEVEQSALEPAAAFAALPTKAEVLNDAACSLQ